MSRSFLLVALTEICLCLRYGSIKLSGAIPGGGGGTPNNGLYGETPPERGTFLRLQV